MTGDVTPDEADGMAAQDLATREGASKCIRPSYGRSYADALTQGGEGGAAAPPAEAQKPLPGEEEKLETPATDSSRHPDLVEHDSVKRIAAEQTLPHEPSTAISRSTARRSASAHRSPIRRTRDSKQIKAKQITLRVNEEEDAEIRKRADAHGLTIAHYVLRKALTADTPFTSRDEEFDAAIDELSAVRAQLGKIGSNINQLARAYNSGAALPPGLVRDAVVHGRSLLEDARHLVAHIDEISIQLARDKRR